jgi:hypothetical protein
MTNIKIDLNYLLLKNKEFTNKFAKSPLMTLIRSTKMDDAKNRMQLLDCIQVFSNYFQKTVMLRFVLNDNNIFGETIQQHLSEEFGHDVSLMNDRKERPPAWDSILDACSCWFSWKMFTLDNSEKTVLVHLVLEASAHLFFIEAHKVMSKYAETDYFKIHAEVDEHHETMGLNLLEDLREIDYKHLLNIQQQGWDILNSVCNRIAELSTSTQ